MGLNTEINPGDPKNDYQIGRFLDATAKTNNGCLFFFPFKLPCLCLRGILPHPMHSIDATFTPWKLSKFTFLQEWIQANQNLVDVDTQVHICQEYVE